VGAVPHAESKEEAHSEPPGRRKLQRARPCPGALRRELARASIGDRQIVGTQSSIAQTHMRRALSGVDRAPREVRSSAGRGSNTSSAACKWAHVAGAFSARCRRLASADGRQLGSSCEQRLSKQRFRGSGGLALTRPKIPFSAPAKTEREWTAHWNEFYDTNLGRAAQKRPGPPMQSSPR